MSREIDEKVLEMRFENEQFEKNVATSMSTLDKLKQSLNLTGAARGLEDINDAAKSFDPSILTTGIETVKNKFSALEVMAITALANITNSAINTGKQLVKSLTVDQITAGWTKYEQKTQSVQTLVNSTGKSVEQINGYLDKLMWFSDETSYSFTDMTAALAQMTSSGGDIDKLIPMITGIANSVAYAGKGSSEFSRAIYNLGQSYSQGFLSLMDWRSVQNAGANSKQLTEELIKAGEELGKIQKGSITVGNFTDSLKKKWADTEVMEKAFGRFSELSEAAYKAVEAGKYDTASEAIEALSKNFDTLSVRAFKSAQEAKSFTEAIDATKDAVSSGWLNTFEIIFGNYEEAKTLWTDLANALWDSFASGAEARNELLKEWKDLGGRDILIKSFWNAWNGVAEVINTVKKAFRDVFPEVTAKKLLNFTKGLENLTSKLLLSEESLEKIGTVFKGLFSILDIGKQAVSSVLNPVFSFLTGGTVSSIGDGLLTAAANIGEFFIRLDKGAKEGKAFAVISDTISTALDKVSVSISKAKDSLSGIKGVFSSVFNTISRFAKVVKNVLSKIFTWIEENISAKDVFAGLAGGGLFVLAKNLSDVVKKIKDILDKLGRIFDKSEDKPSKFSEVLGDVRITLQQFTKGIRVASILAIAGSIALLSSSLQKIAELNPIEVTYSLGAIAAMMATLNIGFRSISKSLSKFNSTGTVKAAISMSIIAESINILASAMDKIGKLPLDSLITGLTGVGASLFTLVMSVKAINKIDIPIKTSLSLIAFAEAMKIFSLAISEIGNLSWDDAAKGTMGAITSLMAIVTTIKLLDKVKIPIKTSISLLALASALAIISKAFSKFGKMSWSKISRGLYATGGALVEFSGVIAIMNKIGGKNALIGSASMLIAAKSLGDIATALKQLGAMSWDEVGRGLVAMGGALAELGLTIGLLGKIAGFSGLLGAATLLIAVKSLSDLADAFQKFGSMQWDEIGRGLVAMGGALLEVGAVAGALGALTGIAGLLGAATLLIAVKSLSDLADAFQKFGSMQWDEIGRGLVAMGGALLEVGAVAGALGALTGIAGLVGAGTLYLAIQGLDDLAEAFQKFGSMQWDEIGRGLVAMGGALLEVGGISGAVGVLAGIGGLVGAGTLYLGIQGLEDLAGALIKFGSMQWDEIKRGLIAMGAALIEIGGISGAVGLLTHIGGIVGAGTLNLGIQGLEDLAGALIKFGSMEWEEIGRGLSAMIAALGGIAVGGVLNTLSGIGASAISKVAKPLGTLADSMKKWEDVRVEADIGTQLGDLAKGVEAFSFAFAGGWSIKSLVGPLGDLSASVSKWSEIKVPANINSMLTDLAKGVEAFSFAFVGGFSISSLVVPLGQLVDPLIKWKNVKIPASIKDSLKNIADGIKQFALLDSVKIKGLAEPLAGVSLAFKRFANVTISSDAASNLVNASVKIKKAITTLSGITELSKQAKNSIESVTKIFDSIENVNVERINNFVTATNKLSKIKVGDIQIDGDNLRSTVSSVKSVMLSMTKTISGEKESLNSSMQTALSGLPKTISSKKNDISSATKVIMDSLVKSISDKSKYVVSAIKTVLNDASRAVSSHSGTMSTAGKQLGDGLVIGIQSKYTAVYNAAYKLGQKAVQGERDGQQSKSPSKLTEQSGIWFGEGLINGIKRMYNSVYSAARNMGTGASDSLSESMSRVMDIVSMDANMQPTIKPILDLSDVERGANSLNGMFSIQQPVRVMADLRSANLMANNRSQVASNDDVIFALGRLETAIKSNPGNVYNINGITYDDGSNIRDAISTLVRAARVERRT